MAANIEQIFSDFVVNKIKEIEESQDNSFLFAGPTDDKGATAIPGKDEISKIKEDDHVHKKHKKHKKHKSKKKRKKRKEGKDSSSESAVESDGGAQQDSNGQEGHPDSAMDSQIGEEDAESKRSKRHSGKKKKKRRKKDENKNSSASESESMSGPKESKLRNAKDSSSKGRSRELPDIVSEQHGTTDRDARRRSRSRSHSARRRQRSDSRSRYRSRRSRTRSRSRSRHRRSRSRSGRRSRRTRSRSVVILRKDRRSRSRSRSRSRIRKRRTKSRSRSRSPRRRSASRERSPSRRSTSREGISGSDDERLTEKDPSAVKDPVSRSVSVLKEENTAVPCETVIPSAEKVANSTWEPVPLVQEVRCEPVPLPTLASECPTPPRECLVPSEVPLNQSSSNPQRQQPGESGVRTNLSASKSPPRITELNKDRLLDIAKAKAVAVCVKAGMPIPESLRPKAAPMLPLSLPPPFPAPMNLPMNLSLMPMMAMNAALASMIVGSMTAALNNMEAMNNMPQMAPLPSVTNKPPPGPPQPSRATMVAVEEEEKVDEQDELISMKEFTNKCKNIVEKGGELAVAQSHHSDEEDDWKPFGGSGLKEVKAISFNLNNLTVRPALGAGARGLGSDAAYAKESPSSSGSQHQKKEGKAGGPGAYGEWVPVKRKGVGKVKAVATAKAAALVAKVAPSEEASSGEVASGVPLVVTPVVDTDSVFPEQPPQPVDITQALSERIKAERRLAENPFDVTAICALDPAQEEVDAWDQSTAIPGLFTGTTGAQVLSSEELSNSGPQALIEKVSDIVSMWQDLSDFEQQRVVFAASYQSKVDTGMSQEERAWHSVNQRGSHPRGLQENQAAHLDQWERDVAE